MEDNISEKQAGITWLQYLISMVFTVNAVFWGTGIYKDLQFETQKTLLNAKEIILVADQSKRRIKNSEERTKLEQSIQRYVFKIEILEKEIDYCKNK